MLLEKFKKYISKRALVDQTERVLLAVSGGRDSMVMLDLFVRSGYDVAIAHCNFSLRGDESDSDQILVESAAKNYGVKIHLVRFDTRKEASNHGESIQMAARRLRYEWFEDLCRNEGYDRIAIAHHGDDSTETFFINLLRGTGLRGLTGISSANGRVVRPLLFATRDQITDYAAQLGVRYANDSSNEEVKYLRNRLRHDIIPRLADSTSSFTDTMADNLERLEQAQRFIDSQIDKIRREAITGNIIDIDIVERSGNANFVLFEILYPYGFPPEVIEDLSEALNSSGKRFFAPRYMATVDRRRVIIEERVRKEVTEEFIDENDPRIERVDMSRLISLETASNVALLSFDSVEFPLRVRKWKEGDWFVPLGMKGQKKVSDFLVDAKVPLTEKETQCVLTAGDSIMWLIGRRIDDRYKVTEMSQKVLRITL